MVTARRIGLLVLIAWMHVGGTCGGGSGGGGSAPVKKVEAPDSRCLALASQFPPGFDLVPNAPGLAIALSFTPGVAEPVDLEPVPPAVAAPGPFVDLRSDIARDACSGFLDPAFAGVLAVAPDLAFVSASSCEGVAFVRSDTGALRSLDVSVPAGFAPGDEPFNPAPGTTESRVALSTRFCVDAAPGAVDSFGAAIPPGCDSARPSFFSNFTSAAALVAGSLFVSTSNLGRNAGRPDTQFLPGSVLVFDLDLTATPPSIGPDPTTPLIFTSGFNPTHVTSYRTPGGRDLVLVTVSGATGLVADDPSTPEREAGGVALTPAAIDVIDAAQRRLIATVPLGLAALSYEELAIDPTGRVAFTGSAIARRLYAVDLAPLDALPTDPSAPVQVLDGSSGPDARIFDAAHPFEVPARPDGAPVATCPGYIVGTAFSAAGDALYATDFCDGTLTLVGVDVSGSPPAPVPGDSSHFQVLRSIPIAAPLDPSSLGLARAPGAVRVRPGIPGVDYHGPDVFFLVGLPEGALCGVRIDSQ